MNNSEGHLSRLATLTAHAGTERNLEQGDVVSPIHLTTTFHRRADSTSDHGYVYARFENPTRKALESMLAQLEGGAVAAAFSSGNAAMLGVFLALQPGDHVVAHHQLYTGTRRQLEQILIPWGLKVNFVNLTDAEKAKSAIIKGTKLVWIESPTNPQMEIIDIQLLAKLVHDAGGLLAVDNTFASPVGQQPLELGADIVMHSTTKVISGHSDVTGGAIISKKDDGFFARIREVQQLGGGVPSPFDCYQIMRGMRSLVPRYQQQAANAFAVATYLHTHPKVEAVFYPGLATHPQFETAQRQMYSAGTMLSFTLKSGREAAFQVISRCKVWLCATSLGGTESLMEHRASSEGEGTTTPDNLIRLSTGLEDAGMLIQDLEEALG